MPKRAAGIAYREFLLVLSLFLLLGILAAGAAASAFIFPPYMRAEAVSESKTTALDRLALPSAAAGVCVLLAGSRDARFGAKRAALLAACAASIPAGAAALRLGDAYNACNYVPPAVLFTTFSAAAIVARGFLSRAGAGKKRAVAAVICSVPAALLAVLTAAASFSGHRLFATLAFFYLPIPFCAAAALAASAVKPKRTAAAFMCVPLSVCIFCALRPYGFDFAFRLCAAFSLILPALAVAAAIADYRKTKTKHTGE